MRGPVGEGPGSNVWVPWGSQTTAPLVSGQGFPSTAAPPVQLTPTPPGDSTVHFEPSFSTRRTVAAAAGRNGKSGGRIEFSKYRATRGNAPAARCTSSNNSV